MAQERSCVHPFIKRVRHIFKNKGSFKDALNEIDGYQTRVSTVYKDNTYFIHALAVSRGGLGSIVAYEYLSSRGLPLPDLRIVINKITPAKALSERLLLKEQPGDERHNLIEKIYKT